MSGEEVNASAVCPACGKRLPADAFQGLCPICLAGLAAGRETTGRGGRAPAGAPERTAAAVRSFGDYELVGEIASGGMGKVYLARQLSLNRTVALKMIRSGQLATGAELGRFRHEAETAARLDHPNIVPIYEVGEHQGRHYFSMKLVEGGNLGALIAGGVKREGPWLRRSARLIGTVARAVHHAHQRGVLHRDIKPTNILLDEAGEPHLGDFGLAKLVQAGRDLTQTIAILGTPHYMAPEQATGKMREVTAAADIYGLGAVLFELLCGRPVFEGDSALEVLRRAQEQEAPALRRMNPVVDRDLETICRKCLEKEPGRRYPSAEDLAEDLEHWLAGEPVRARPAGVVEEAFKWARRKPAVAALILLAHVLFLAGIVGVLWQWRRAETEATRATDSARQETLQREQAELANTRLRETVERLELQHADTLLADDQVGPALARLARVLHRNPSNVVAASRVLSVLEMRKLPLPLLPPFHHDAAILAAHFDPRGRTVLTASADGAWRLWDAISGEMLVDRKEDRTEILDAAFSPDGSRIATGCADGSVVIRDAETGEPLLPSMHLGERVKSVVFSPEGRFLASLSGNKTLTVWDVQTGRPVGRPFHYPLDVRFVAFTPDASRVVTTSLDKVRVFHTATGRLERELSIEDGTEVFYKQSIRPDGSALVAGRSAPFAYVWDLNDLDAPPNRLPHGSSVWWVAYSRDGRWLATASQDGMARIWDGSSGNLLFGNLAHFSSVERVVFSPDASRLLTVSTDRMVRIWDVRTGMRTMEPLLHDGSITAAEFSPDGRRFLTASDHGVATVWAVDPPRHQRPTMESGGPMRRARFSPDGNMLATVTGGGEARVWNALTGAPVSPAFKIDQWSSEISFSPDGTRVLLAGRSGWAGVLDARTLQPIHAPIPHRAPAHMFAARWSPDNRLVLTASPAGFGLWDSMTGRQVGDYFGAGLDLGVFDVTADGRQVAFGFAKRRTAVFDLVSRQRTATGPTHTSTMTFLACSGDGRLVASCGHNGETFVWDIRSGRLVIPPLQQDGRVNFASFGMNSRRLVTAADDGSAQVWDLESGQPLGGRMRHRGPLLVACFSHDGLRIVTCSQDTTARIWDANTGLPLTEPFCDHSGVIQWVEFDSGGGRVATACKDGTACIWDVPRPPLPVPEWLPQLAEAIAGQALEEDSSFKRVLTSTAFQIKSRLQELPEADFFVSWGQWFFADPETRAYSPYGPALNRADSHSSLVGEAARSPALNERALKELRRQADRAFREGRLGDAEFAGTKIFGQLPDDANNCYLLARIAARRGEMERAAPLFRRALRADPRGNWESFQAAYVFQRVGWQEDYRGACQRLLDNVSVASKGTDIERMIRVCLLDPRPVGNLEELRRMIDVVLAKNRSGKFHNYCRAAKALLEYRAGRHAAAARLLEPILQTGADWAQMVDALTLSALAAAGAGNQDLAVGALEQARRLTRENSPDLASNRFLDALGWQQWLQAVILADEAEQFLGLDVGPSDRVTPFRLHQRTVCSLNLSSLDRRSTPGSVFPSPLPVTFPDFIRCMG